MSEPIEAVETKVAVMLGEAGLVLNDEEFAVLVGAYPMFKAAIEALHVLPGVRYEAPGVVFDALPAFDDWAP